MIYIYTETLTLWPRIKKGLKILLGRDRRGPQAVEAGLLSGLNKLGKTVFLNKKNIEAAQAGVISGAGSLRWAIKQKKEGKIKMLIAGPNITVTPFDDGGLITDPAIDKILVPSEWTKNWWLSLNPQLQGRLFVWAAGIKDRGGRHCFDTGTCLVYKKAVPEKLFFYVTAILQKMGLKYRVVKYGHYKPEDYQNMLFQSDFMIYLTETESQGMALAEAWMTGVPTIVWSQGVLLYKNFRWEDEKISAPYLTEKCGLFFKGEEDFEKKLTEFLACRGKFDPRGYALSNFIEEIAARKYLDLFA